MVDPDVLVGLISTERSGSLKWLRLTGLYDECFKRRTAGRTGACAVPVVAAGHLIIWPLLLPVAIIVPAFTSFTVISIFSEFSLMPSRYFREHPDRLFYVE